MSGLGLISAVPGSSPKLEIPDGPYKIKEGKHAGEYLENLIFGNTKAFFEVVDNSAYAKNGLAKHVHFLLSVPLKTVMFCPYCQQERVDFFSPEPEGRYIPVSHAACTNCLDKFTTQGHQKILPIKLSTLRLFTDDLQQDIAQHFMKLYGLCRKDKDGIFDFFETNYRRSPVVQILTC